MIYVNPNPVELACTYHIDEGRFDNSVPPISYTRIAYEPPRECTSASYWKVNCAAGVIIDSVVVIALVQSGLAVSAYLVVL